MFPATLIYLSSISPWKHCFYTKDSTPTPLIPHKSHISPSRTDPSLRWGRIKWPLQYSKKSQPCQACSTPYFFISSMQLLLPLHRLLHQLHLQTRIMQSSCNLHTLLLTSSCAEDFRNFTLPPRTISQRQSSQSMPVRHRTAHRPYNHLICTLICCYPIHRWQTSVPQPSYSQPRCHHTFSQPFFNIKKCASSYCKALRTQYGVYVLNCFKITAFRRWEMFSCETALPNTDLYEIGTVFFSLWTTL